MHVILQDLRCFQERQVIPTRPLTFLVGENSTGKTTFLAACRIAWDVTYGNSLRIDFNEEPFQLGTFDQLANSSRGRRAKSFSVGKKIELPVTHKMHYGISEAVVAAEFEKGDAQPHLRTFEIGAEPYRFKAIRGEGARGTKPKFEIYNGQDLLFSEALPYPLAGSAYSIFEDIWLDLTSTRSGAPPFAPNVTAAIRVFKSLVEELWRGRSERPHAISPIRSKPQRVYSWMEDTPVPTGEHVPLQLYRTLFGKATKQSKVLLNQIETFGKSSGLFDTLKVKRFGKSEGDPLQILVGHRSLPFNLADVGYGVSQSLPILADTLISPKRTKFLLQQPEVHLHPRAQAELGTFFSLLVKEHAKRFVIETHSDAMIDRVRMDVRDARIQSSDVMILYFEKARSGVEVHPITVDDNGNICGAPDSYRSFFMREEERYFGVS